MRLASSSIRELRQQRFTAISTTPYKATSLTSLAAHTLGAGVYLGEYAVEADDNSLVFDVDSAGNQEGPPFFPVRSNKQCQQDQSAVRDLSGRYLANHRETESKCRCALGSFERLYLQQSDRSDDSIWSMWRGRTPLFTPVSPGICKCRAFRASRPALLQRLPAPPAWREPARRYARDRRRLSSGMPV